ncbi:unnamed protein product, partial [Discosporangium mesarthrocarpum]
AECGAESKFGLEQLLLDIYSSLPEPDSIYGAPASGAGLSSQATVYAHEGVWLHALPMYDTLSQQPTPFLGGLGYHAPGDPTGLQAGVATSLQRMGLQHVLEHYLRGLRVGPSTLRGLADLEGGLRDLQFEAAWRVCEWDPALLPHSHSGFGPFSDASSSLSYSSQRVTPEAGGQSWQGVMAGSPSMGGPNTGLTRTGAGAGAGAGDNGREGFHEYVLQALQSLQQRNACVFGSAVGQARSGALTRLRSGAAHEGGKELYPSLVQLQLLAEMEEFSDVLLKG